MGSDRTKIIRIASMYTGIILGAGFASGQEIARFFTRYGFMGLAGLLLSGVIFSFVGYMVMSICIDRKVFSYTDFVNKTMGKYLGTMIEAAVMFFLVVLYCTMLAAGGAAVKEMFGLSFTGGVIIVAGLCLAALLCDIEGILKINAVLVPVLVIGGLFISLYTISKNISPEIFNMNGGGGGWIKGAVLYASYNVITAITVLCTLNEVGINKKIALRSSVIAGFIMTALGLTIALALMSTDVRSEIPMLSIVASYSNSIRILYFVILFAAIFTTAIGNAFAIQNYFRHEFKMNPALIKLLVTCVGIIFAHIGFSNFVGKVYPVFGYIGLFQIILLACKGKRIV